MAKETEQGLGTLRFEADPETKRKKGAYRPVFADVFTLPVFALEG